MNTSSFILGHFWTSWECDSVLQKTFNTFDNYSVGFDCDSQFKMESQREESYHHRIIVLITFTQTHINLENQFVLTCYRTTVAMLNVKLSFPAAYFIVIFSRVFLLILLARRSNKMSEWHPISHHF